jgi:hypothetical protein
MFMSAKEAGILGKPFVLTIGFAGVPAGMSTAVVLMMPVTVVRNEFTFAMLADNLLRLWFAHNNLLQNGGD